MTKRIKGLDKTRSLRNDEFYTLYSEVERELSRYTGLFSGKVVYCNCDSYYDSQFVKYFIDNFISLGLKCLVCTNYVDRFYPFREGYHGEEPYFVSITEVVPGMGLRDLVSLGGNSLSVLSGDGDFRSEECVNILRDCDIVVTNPPFSLFREYFPAISSSGKDFVLLCGHSHLPQKGVVPLLLSGKVGLGYSSGDMRFRVPCGDCITLSRLCWLTSLPLGRECVKLPLVKSYDSSLYPYYDNYDAIEVSRVSDIPRDYYGLMGVPLSYLFKHNPEQFEILGASRYFSTPELSGYYTGDRRSVDLDYTVSVGGVVKMFRVFIRRVDACP